MRGANVSRTMSRCNQTLDTCSSSPVRIPSLSSFFFFNDTATTEIYTLSLHDALPICAQLLLCMRWGQQRGGAPKQRPAIAVHEVGAAEGRSPEDRKSTRLNSSHLVISYAVFCLKKKKNNFHILPTSYIIPPLPTTSAPFHTSS